MTTKNASDDLLELRRNAEHRLEKRLNPSTPPVTGDAHLVHELAVHQVELEMQNDELRGTREELERALDRYTALFNFAPIGYASARADGTILQLNHAGARIFGRPRAQMEGLRLQAFIAEGDLLIFAAMLDRLKASKHDPGLEIAAHCEVRLLCDAGVFCYVRFSATEFARGERELLLLAFEDITERRARRRARADPGAAERRRRAQGQLPRRPVSRAPQPALPDPELRRHPEGGLR